MPDAMNPTSSFSSSGRWIELPAVSGLFAGLPATVAATIFGMSVQKPLTERIAPDLVHLHQTLASRLQLTAPLTLGVALIAILWFTRTPAEWNLRVLFSTLALLLTTWLGKVLAFGLAADMHASTGHFVNDAGHLVWQADAAGALSHVLEGSIWTRGIALLINYFQLYGPEQFCLSVACGAALGGYWAYRATRFFRGY